MISANESIINAVTQQSEGRKRRAQIIAEKLKRLGFENCLEGAQSFAGSHIGRPHFAQYLVQIGAVKNINQAFKKYLGAGKVGDIKDEWADLKTVVGWIHQAGGVAVLAHPKEI